MSLQHILFNQIDEAALAKLVASNAAESKTLEFKQDLQLVTDEQKREFLSDITALANSDGGDIIFGVRADKGMAAELIGLRNFSPDDRIGQLENLLRDCVQPRLSGLQAGARKLSNGNDALILRIPRSFAAPHMVRHQGVTRFCGRNATGKYDLDVHELRSAFIASETMSGRLKTFRLDRINKLLSVDTPVTLTSKHLMVLHLLPLVSVRPDIRFTTVEFNRTIEIAQPRPMGSRNYCSSFNIDGVMVTSRLDDAYHGFVQLYRNGFLESVESQTLKPREDVGQIIPSIAWEKYIVDSFATYLKAMEVLNLPPPYVASLSLLNVRGYSMFVGSEYWGSGNGRKIDRDHLLTDEVLIESPTQSPGRILRPLFDQVWNGCGWPQSINYDNDGDWVGWKKF